MPASDVMRMQQLQSRALLRHNSAMRSTRDNQASSSSSSSASLSEQRVMTSSKAGLDFVFVDGCAIAPGRLGERREASRPQPQLLLCEPQKTTTRRRSDVAVKDESRDTPTIKQEAASAKRKNKLRIDVSAAQQYQMSHHSASVQAANQLRNDTAAHSNCDRDYKVPVVPPRPVRMTSQFEHSSSLRHVEDTARSPLDSVSSMEGRTATAATLVSDYDVPRRLLSHSRDVCVTSPSDYHVPKPRSWSQVSGITSESVTEQRPATAVTPTDTCKSGEISNTDVISDDTPPAIPPRRKKVTAFCSDEREQLHEKQTKLSNSIINATDGSVGTTTRSLRVEKTRTLVGNSDNARTASDYMDMRNRVCTADTFPQTRVRRVTSQVAHSRSVEDSSADYFCMSNGDVRLGAALASTTTSAGTLLN